MKTAPIPLRLEAELQKLLKEGARRTPHKKQELVRLTLRRHLRDVIEQEAKRPVTRRVTNVEPWPEGILRAAYERLGSDWDTIEEAATRAQGLPNMND